MMIIIFKKYIIIAFTMAQEYLHNALRHYDHLKQTMYHQILLVYPRFDNYNHFQKFIMLNLLIISVYLILSCIGSISLTKIYQSFMHFVFNLWFVRKQIYKQLEEAKVQILHEYPQHLRPKLDKIPYKIPNQIIGDASDKESLKGKLSGSRYAVESHSKFVMNIAKQFSYANPLHIQVFPYVKQMQNQVIDMSAQLIGLKDQNNQPCGTLNSGGTESIMMAIFAYRQYGYKQRGIRKPNMVICDTGHPAAIKACHYLDIEIRLVPCNNNYQMNISKMKSAIDSQTICIYSSYPNYPYGIADDIDTIAKICKKRSIPLHVDMCLGGFIVPFIDQTWKVPSGVTSISADPHKYGLAAKGVSIVLYSSDKYRRHQYFTTSYWPGGLYFTPGVAGSRTGVYIASAWVSMMNLGIKGYKQNGKLVQQSVLKVAKQLRSLGFQVMGQPKICIVAFRHHRIPIGVIQRFMKKRGWGLSLQQKPACLHFSFTPLNSLQSNQMIKDFRQMMAFYDKNPIPNEKHAEMQLYGACAKIKDGGTKHLLLATILDTYIDLS